MEGGVIASGCWGRKDGQWLLERALSATQNGVMVTDATKPDDPIVYVNPAFERITGYSSEEAIGRNPRFLQAGDGYQPALDDLRASRESNDDGWTGVLCNYKKDGMLFYNELVVAAVRDEEGRASHRVGVMTDVTERERAEEALKESEQRFRYMVQNSSDLITLVGADGTILYSSPALERVLGYRPEERVGRSIFDLLHPDDAARARGLFAEGLGSPGVRLKLEVRQRHRDGSWRDVEVTGTNLLDDPSTGAVVLNSRDVTERRRAEEALKQSEERFRQLFEQSADALLVHDEAGMVVDCNAAAYRSLGYSREELLALSVEDFGIKLVSDEEGLDKDRMLWQRLMAAEPGTVTGVVLGMHRRKDGTTFPVEVGLSGIDYGGRRMILASCRDLTEREVLEERLTHQAFHDSLTGLPNRALFFDRLEQALSRAERREGRVAVLFLDLDNFKYVNDSLGHDAGDGLLVAVAGRLRGCVRPEDTVARLGGDEFAVLLEARDAGETTRVARRIVEALREPFELGGREVFAGTSVGIALGEAGRERPDDLLRKADLALYEAKRGGKARYALFDPEAERRSMRRLELENGLRRALERDEFRVCYQGAELGDQAGERLRGAGALGAPRARPGPPRRVRAPGGGDGPHTPYRAARAPRVLPVGQGVAGASPRRAAPDRRGEPLGAPTFAPGPGRGRRRGPG